MVYKIEKITYKDGTERNDGRYPLRKGCIGCLCDVNVGQMLWFNYLQDSEGNDKSGYLRTSMVNSVDTDDTLTIIETLNSVYYFRKIV